MALFTSSIITQASGSVGGSTYARNRGGLYIRNRAIPVDPQTPNQQKVRAIMANLTTRWTTTLSEQQRSAWNAYAVTAPVIGPLGTGRNIGGLGWYIRSNAVKAGAESPYVDNPPSSVQIPVVTSPSLEINVSDQVVVAYDPDDEWAGAQGGVLAIQVSRPVNPSVNFFKGPWQNIGYVLRGAAAPVPPFSGTSPFAFTSGRKVFIRLVGVTADGRPSYERITSGLAS